MPKNNELANKVNNSSHVSTLAHDTGKETLFDNAQVTGYLSATVPLNPRYKYCWVGAVGDCLDSPDSPMRIKDGDKLLVHEIPLSEMEILIAVRKTVCIILKSGECYVKQLIFADFLSRSLTLRMYNPVKKLYLRIDKIKALFVVDDVVDGEYMELHKKPIPGKCSYFEGVDITDVTPIKETTLEDVKQYAQERQRVIKAYVLKQMAIHGLKNLPAGELQMGLFIMGCDNPHEEMINMITQYSNSMAQAWESHIKVLAMEKQQQETIMI